MTETKRFELRLCSNGTYYVYENGTLTDIDFDKFNKESAYALIDEVNALYDENEQLKQENNKLQGKYDHLLWLYNGLGCDYDGLKDENMELKQQNEFLKRRCNEYWEEAGLNSDYFE